MSLTSRMLCTTTEPSFLAMPMVAEQQYNPQHAGWGTRSAGAARLTTQRHLKANAYPSSARPSRRPSGGTPAKGRSLRSRWPAG
eukprot:scaffold8034_cov739-Prasinococcus_capsulatus_cf.AAC.1